MNHIDSDCQERYILDQLHEDDRDQVEEHLLICEECRGAIGETEYLIAAVRQALTAETKPYTENQRVVAITIGKKRLKNSVRIKQKYLF